MSRTYRTIAASLAELKRQRPDLFCPIRECLLRTGGPFCPRHGDEFAYTVERRGYDDAPWVLDSRCFTYEDASSVLRGHTNAGRGARLMTREGVAAVTVLPNGWSVRL